MRLSDCHIEVNVEIEIEEELEVEGDIRIETLNISVGVIQPEGDSLYNCCIKLTYAFLSVCRSTVLISNDISKHEKHQICTLQLLEVDWFFHVMKHSRLRKVAVFGRV